MRVQHERLKVRRPCIKYLRECKKKRVLRKYDNVYFACPPDLGILKPPQQAAAKADGYEKGVFDLTIIAASENISKVWLIEFKWEKNPYTKEQKLVAESFKNTPIGIVVIRTEAEFVKFVENNLM